jgi:hypothetical protein
MVYDGFCYYFLSTCHIHCQGDLVVYFTFFFALKIKKFETNMILDHEVFQSPKVKKTK